MIWGVDRIIHFKMEDLPNVIQPALGKQGLEQMLFTHAVPQEAGAVTLMHTVNVLDAMTSGQILQVMFYR